MPEPLRPPRGRRSTRRSIETMGGCDLSGYADGGSVRPSLSYLAISELEHLEFLARVGTVLELDDSQLLEPRAKPAIGGVEQPQLLAVGHDLREQHGLEELPL